MLGAGDNKMSKAWVLRNWQWRSQINEYTLPGKGEVREVQICSQSRGTPIYSLLYLSMPSRMLKTQWMNVPSGCVCECVLCTGQVIQGLRKIFNGRDCIYYFYLLKVAYCSLSNCFRFTSTVNRLSLFSTDLSSFIHILFIRYTIWKRNIVCYTICKRNIVW